jgi:NADPH-dependent 2,4-dienoyl-CoA reductase/sulfur reductase-like enzyme
MNSPEVLVVGAGPGGIAAALEVARVGGSVWVVDEYPQPGGQYLRQPAPGLEVEADSRVLEHVSEGVRRVKEAKDAGVRFLQQALAWGAFSDGSLAILSGGKAELLTPGKVILAVGAREGSVAFPGWTLPGVMTAGAAQALVGGQGILPGRRILMAGTGPLQLAVAAQLVRAGGHLVGVLEANGFGILAGSALRGWGQWERLWEGVRYWRTLRSAGVPLVFGRTVVRATGRGQLERVVTAALDSRWKVLPGTELETEIDTLCLGFWLMPNTKLARLLGCDTTYDPSRGGLVPVHNDRMETSRPGVFVVGETAGIAGAKAAELQGRIAGTAAAQQLGRGNPAEMTARLATARDQLARELRFARYLNEVFSVKPGLLDLITDETVVCRCEEITWGQWREERSEWANTLDAVRMTTRTGFGLCQGNVCESLVGQLLARETGKAIGELGTYHIRPPITPITLGALADLTPKLPPPPMRMEHSSEPKR